MKLSDRDRRLFILIGVIVLGLIYYFIPYRILNKWENIEKAELSKLDSEFQTLLLDIPKKDEYLKDIEQYTEELEEFQHRYPLGVTEERILYTMTDIEKSLNISFPSINITPLELVNLKEEKQKVQKNGEVLTIENIKDMKRKHLEKGYLGKELTKNEELENFNTDIVKDEVVIKSTVSSSTVTTYQGVKDLLKYLYEGTSEDAILNRRVVLNGLTMNLLEDNRSMDVSFTLDFYGVLNTNRLNEELEIDLGDFSIGRNTVFQDLRGVNKGETIVQQGDKEAGRRKEDRADFDILLNPISSDISTTVIAVTGDDSRKTYAYDDREGIVKGEIKFTQSNGKYYYRYKVGSDSTPNNYRSGVAFDPGKYIELQVISSKRNSTGDKSGCKLSIINETDLEVNVFYSREDYDRPRLEIIDTKGKVTLP